MQKLERNDRSVKPEQRNLRNLRNFGFFSKMKFFNEFQVSIFKFVLFCFLVTEPDVPARWQVPETTASAVWAWPMTPWWPV